jgi:hypothetical protein
MLLVQSSQLLIHKVLGRDRLFIFNVGILEVGTQAGVAEVVNEVFMPVFGFWFMGFGVGRASAASYSSASLVDLQDITHAEFFIKG